MIARILVILAVAAGVAAFFLPLVNVDAKVTVDGAMSSHAFDFSTFQIIQGASGVESAMGGFELPAEQRESVNEALNTIKAIVLIPFAPTAIFLLITLFGLKRFGRGLGITSLIIGLVAVGGWALINGAAKEQPNSGAAFGIALTLILVGGGLGILGGIMGIAKPEAKANAAG
jgi:hypothetical protein